MAIPTCSYFLDKRYILKDGSYPIKLSVYYLGTKKRYKTGFTATEEDYKKIKEGTTRLEQIRKQKNTMNIWLDEQREITQSLRPFSFNSYEKILFKKEIAAKSEVTDDVESLFTDHIGLLKRKNRFTTATTYQTAANSLKNYQKFLKISEIDKDFLEEYEKDMLANGRSLTTVGFYLRALRAIFNNAIKKGIVDQQYYPFREYTIPAPRKTKRALKKNDLIKLFDYLPDTEAKKEALDFWKFSFICNGMNFKDIALLKNEDIKGDFIEFNRSKTKNTKRVNVLPIRVPLCKETREIINKYRNISRKPKDYLFTILNDNMTGETIDKTIDQFIQVTNKWTKRIANELDISLKLTTYVARHSFATTQKNNGVSNMHLKESLGHATILQLENYLGSFEDEEMIEVHGRLLQGIVK